MAQDLATRIIKLEERVAQLERDRLPIGPLLSAPLLNTELICRVCNMKWADMTGYCCGNLNCPRGVVP